jgi:hypothetical protein
MRIGIDAAVLSERHAGIPRAVSEILRALQQIDYDNDYYLYSRLDFDFALKNPRWRKSIHPRIPYLLGSLYLREGMKSGGSDDGLDVFWTTRTHAFPL